jgi:hypothetical protein
VFNEIFLRTALQILAFALPLLEVRSAIPAFFASEGWVEFV